MIRALAAADLPAAVALLERTGLSSGASNVARYLRWQPDGAWGLFDGGALVGMVTLLRFGHVGFVGCMAVDPSRQSRGAGRGLLEHAHGAARRAGVMTMLLEATASGARLYEKLGYAFEHDTLVVSRTQVTSSEPVPLAAFRSEILALDRLATGSPRDPMIGDLVDHHGGGIERARELAAYGLVVGDRLGPVIARDPGAGRALVARLAGACTVAGVPAHNEPAITAFADHGFAHVRTLRRMRLGPPVAATPGWVWALASAGAG